MSGLGTSGVKHPRRPSLEQALERGDSSRPRIQSSPPLEKGDFHNYRKNYTCDPAVLTHLGSNGAHSFVNQVIDSGRKIGAIDPAFVARQKWDKNLSYYLLRAQVHQREIDLVIGTKNNNSVEAVKWPSEELESLQETADTIMKLYPADTNANHATGMDQALKAFDLQKAQELVNQKQGDQPAGDFWFDVAMNKHQQPDFFRALLVLAPRQAAILAKTYLEPDEDEEEYLMPGEVSVRSVLHGDMHAVDEQGRPYLDEGLRDCLNEIPHPSAPFFINTNNKDGFDCTELVALRCQLGGKLPDSEIDEILGSAEKRAENYDPASQLKRYVAICHQSDEAYVALNEPHASDPKSKASGHLNHDQFQGMKAGEVKRFVVASPNHSMMLELKVQRDRGRTWYMADLYDPNNTNIRWHAQTDRLKATKNWTIPSFLESSTKCNDYYPNSRHSMLMAVPDEAQLHSPMSSLPEGRDLSSMAYTDSVYDGGVIYQLLFHGFDRPLEGLKDTMRDMSSRQAYDMLMFEGIDHSTGVFVVFQEGHGKAFRRVCEAMAGSKLTPEQIIPILTKSPQGMPSPLLTACYRGHTEIVLALLDYLPNSGLSHDQIDQILTAPTKSGLSPSELAESRNHHEIAQAIAHFQARHRKSE